MGNIGGGEGPEEVWGGKIPFMGGGEGEVDPASANEE